MLLASFGVLNVLCHYFMRVFGSVFSVLTTIVASVDKSCISRAAASTFEVEAIIMITSDRWIDIRRSGLFSSVESRVEI